MLRMDSTNTSYSASSVVNGESIATFSAGVNNPSDSVYFSIGINSLTALQDNLITIKADLEQFIDTVAD